MRSTPITRLHDAICACESFGQFNAEVFPALVEQMGAGSASFQAVRQHSQRCSQDQEAHWGVTHDAHAFYQQQASRTFLPLLFDIAPQRGKVDLIHLRAAQAQRVGVLRELWSVSGVAEMLMLRITVAAGAHFLLGLHRHAGDSAFSDADHERLGAVSLALHSTLRRLQLEDLLQARAPTDSPPGNAARHPAFASLTPRECELAKQVALGLSNKAIARQHGISFYTVENHRR